MADKVYIDLATGKPVSVPAGGGSAKSTITVKSGSVVITAKSPNLRVVRL